MSAKTYSTEANGATLSPKMVLVIFSALLLGTLGVVAALSDPQVRLTRLLTVIVIFVILGLALFDHLYEIIQLERTWQQLARRTGLICRVDGFFLTGYAVEVGGHYQGRMLSLATYKQGKSQVPSTRITLAVKNETGARLRLRGPFKPGEANSDKVTSDLFQAAEARQFGHDQRFFIRSQPVHLVTSMFRPGPLRTKLAQLESLVNIELDKQTLHFNQLGVLGDVDYLEFLFDLLSDLADAVEKGGYVKLNVAA